MFAKNRYCKSFGAVDGHPSPASSYWIISKGMLCTVNDGINKSSVQVVGLVFLGLLGLALAWIERITLPTITWKKRMIIVACVIVFMYIGGWYMQLLLFPQYFN